MPEPLRIVMADGNCPADTLAASHRWHEAGRVALRRGRPVPAKRRNSLLRHLGLLEFPYGLRKVPRANFPEVDGAGWSILFLAAYWVRKKHR